MCAVQEHKEHRHTFRHVSLAGTNLLKKVEGQCVLRLKQNLLLRRPDSTTGTDLGVPSKQVSS